MATCQKCIIVPNDDEAMEALMLGVDYMHQCSQYCVPPSHFSVLRESGLIQALNRSTGLLIDEYESEIVVGEDRLLRMLECLDDVVADYRGPDSSALAMVRAFLLLAIECETGIGFFF